MSTADDDAAWEVVGSFSCTVKTRIEGTLAEMSTPVSSEGDERADGPGLRQRRALGGRRTVAGALRH